MLSEDMYQENILEHYRYPHNFGSMKNHTASAREVNPLCGDIIEMQLQVESGKIMDVMFSGKGCAISRASASMLTDEIKGKTIEEAKKIDKKNVLEMLGVEISPARLKCAFLGLKALKVCLLTKDAKK